MPFRKIKYTGISGVVYMGERITHVQNSHGTSGADLNDIDAHIQILKNVTLSARGKGIGQYGVPVIGRVDGDKGSYYVVLEINPQSGTVFMGTAWRGDKDSIDHIIDEIRKA